MPLSPREQSQKKTQELAEIIYQWFDAHKGELNVLDVVSMLEVIKVEAIENYIRIVREQKENGDEDSSDI